MSKVPTSVQESLKVKMIEVTDSGLTIGFTAIVAGQSMYEIRRKDEDKTMVAAVAMTIDDETGRIAKTILATVVPDSIPLIPGCMGRAHFIACFNYSMCAAHEEEHVEHSEAFYDQNGNKITQPLFILGF